MRISSITKNAGKACNNRLYRHIRTFKKIVKNYFVIYYKQMKIREIAEALHMPTASVSSRLRRARAMLKIDMEGGKDA